MKILLNLACGVQPQNLLRSLHNFSLENAAGSQVYQVFNVDRDPELARVKNGGGASLIVADASKGLPFGNDSVDVALSVSPFGFSVINAEVLRVLGDGGGVVILGSRRNKWVKGSVATSSDMLAKLREVTGAEDPELGRIADFIAANYVSLTTGGLHETRLDTIRLWRMR